MKDHQPFQTKPAHADPLSYTPASHRPSKRQPSWLRTLKKLSPAKVIGATVLLLVLVGGAAGFYAVQTQRFDLRQQAKVAESDSIGDGRCGYSDHRASCKQYQVYRYQSSNDTAYCVDYDACRSDLHGSCQTDEYCKSGLTCQNGTCEYPSTGGGSSPQMATCLDKNRDCDQVYLPATECHGNDKFPATQDGLTACGAQLRPKKIGLNQRCNYIAGCKCIENEGSLEVEYGSVADGHTCQAVIPISCYKFSASSNTCTKDDFVQFASCEASRNHYNTKSECDRLNGLGNSQTEAVCYNSSANCAEGPYNANSCSDHAQLFRTADACQEFVCRRLSTEASCQRETFCSWNGNSCIVAGEAQRCSAFQDQGKCNQNNCAWSFQSEKYGTCIPRGVKKTMTCYSLNQLESCAEIRLTTTALGANCEDFSSVGSFQYFTALNSCINAQRAASRPLECPTYSFRACNSTSACDWDVSAGICRRSPSYVGQTLPPVEDSGSSTPGGTGDGGGTNTPTPPAPAQAQINARFVEVGIELPDPYPLDRTFTQGSRVRMICQNVPQTVPGVAFHFARPISQARAAEIRDQQLAGIIAFRIPQPGGGYEYFSMNRLTPSSSGARISNPFLVDRNGQHYGVCTTCFDADGRRCNSVLPHIKDALGAQIVWPTSSAAGGSDTTTPPTTPQRDGGSNTGPTAPNNPF